MVLTSVAGSVAQSSDAVSIEEEYDFLTGQWLEVSGELKTYSGLASYCKQPEFRKHTAHILELLHHYDSLVLDILTDPTSQLHVSKKEQQKTIKDIEKFEEKYSLKNFSALLKESCRTYKDLEKNKDDLVKESGMYSYDGQILILETQLRKFLTSIDKRVVAIDDHIHLIHPDQIKPFKMLARKE
jgi:hypothetical protein